MRKIFNILILVFTLLLSVNSANAGSIGSTSSGLYVAWNGYNATSVSGVISCANKITITLIAPYGINYWFSFIYDGVLISSSSAFTSNIGSTEIYNNGQYITEFNNLGYYGEAYPGIKINFNSSGTYTFNFVYENGNIILSNGEAICGPSEPVIADVISSICIPVNLTSLVPSVTYDASCKSNSEWWELDGIEVTSSTIFSPRSKLRYCAKDNTNFETKTFYSNEITLKDKPIIPIIQDDKLCTTSGETYDISQHAINWNSDIGRATYTLNGDAVSSTISDVGTITVDATNTCGDAEQRIFALTSGCKPVVSTLQTPNAVCSGNALLFTAPIVTDTTSTMWQIHLPSDADGVWHDNFDISAPLNFSSHNGAKVRYAATNENGTTYSNEVQLSILSKEPDYTYTFDGTSVFQSYGKTSSTVTYTVNKVYECNKDKIVFDISDDTNFSYDTTSNSITIKLKDGRDLGNYETELSFGVGSKIESVTINGYVKDYPKCYNIDRLISGIYYDTYSLCTDDYGNINIDLNNGDNELTYIKYDESFCDTCKTGKIQRENGNYEEIYSYVSLYPSEDIICNDFIFNGHVKGDQHVYPLFVNTKQIVCDSLYVNTTQAQNYFITECNSVIRANKSITLKHSSEPIEVKGYLISPNIFLSDGNSTSITIDECAFIKTELLELVQSHENSVVVNGHIISDEISSTANIILTYNGDPTNPAIITIGEIASNITVVCGKNTTVNLCKNPNLGDPDKIGLFLGYVLYNKNSDNGWNNIKPSEEGDINYSTLTGFDDSWLNSNWKGIWETNYGISKDDILYTKEIAAYEDYDKCIEEKDMMSFLGYEDDPFAPKDKEIKLLYEPINYCSDKYKNTIIIIRELGNRKFRYINGELIYCEGDN